MVEVKSSMNEYGTREEASRPFDPLKTCHWTAENSAPTTPPSTPPILGQWLTIDLNYHQRKYWFKNNGGGKFDEILLYVSGSYIT